MFNKKQIKIKYFTDIDELEFIGGQSKSNWIDLRAAEDVSLKMGEFKLIPLGIAMELPKGYEAIVAPRSSTFKNFHVIESNSIGVIDASFKGDDDQWFFPAYAAEDTVIHKNDRICQFRIIKSQPDISFKKVDHLSNTSRGGHGSSGVQ